MHSRAPLPALLVFVAVLSGQASAQTVFNFNNSSGGAWSVAGNWTSSGTPPPNSPTDIARFNLGSAYTVDVNGVFDVLALQFGTTQTNAVSLRGLTGSPPRGIVLNPGTGADGSIPANNGRTTVFVQAGSHTIDGTVALTLGGGSAGSPVHHVWEVQGSQNLAVGAPISATLSSGNTLTKVGTGTLTLSGNNAQPQLWDGGLTVAEGTVLANGPSSSTGAGPVTVNSGATLGGRGHCHGLVKPAHDHD